MEQERKTPKVEIEQKYCTVHKGIMDPTAGDEMCELWHWDKDTACVPVSLFYVTLTVVGAPS